jgi:hypothetical protein
MFTWKLLSWVRKGDVAEVRLKDMAASREGLPHATESILGITTVSALKWQDGN